MATGCASVDETCTQKHLEALRHPSKRHHGCLAERAEGQTPSVSSSRSTASLTHLLGLALLPCIPPSPERIPGHLIFTDFPSHSLLLGPSLRRPRLTVQCCDVLRRAASAMRSSRDPLWTRVDGQQAGPGKAGDLGSESHSEVAERQRKTSGVRFLDLPGAHVAQLCSPWLLSDCPHVTHDTPAPLPLLHPVPQV